MLFINFLKKNAEAGQAFLKSYYLSKIVVSKNKTENRPQETEV